jgi:hypothetical protein
MPRTNRGGVVPPIHCCSQWSKLVKDFCKAVNHPFDSEAALAAVEKIREKLLEVKTNG